MGKKRLKKTVRSLAAALVVMEDELNDLRAQVTQLGQDAGSDAQVVKAACDMTDNLKRWVDAHDERLLAVENKVSRFNIIGG